MARSLQYGLFYDRSFLKENDLRELLEWLSLLHPIWEDRYSKNNPPPSGQSQRRLLRPVYWLGNWQFACLNYYHPPHGIDGRCVQAEPFPPVLQRLVKKMESIARQMHRPLDVPRQWHLNTCLVNFYGSRLEEESGCLKKVDVARVGEHKDFEPGPVASLSLGERAMFQFVSSSGKSSRNNVVLSQWLDHGSLQIFGGDKFKKKLFHRVQRVDKRDGHRFDLNLQDFETRRINFTFRYVPTQHVVRYRDLSLASQEDVLPYMEELARHSSFFRSELQK